MFGNLIREAGVLERLSKRHRTSWRIWSPFCSASPIGATMSADKFLRRETLLILAMGLVAFIFDTPRRALASSEPVLARESEPMIESGDLGVPHPTW